MSRIANAPVQIPSGVEVALTPDKIAVKGKSGELAIARHAAVQVSQEDGALVFSASDASKAARSQAGTQRSLVNNMVIGVTEGFQRTMQLIGVGYRVQVQGNKLNFTLGFSHPVEYQLPEGVTAESPSQTELVLKSANKQLLGQVAAEIRAFRAPEPYKGKGVRYADEYVIRKEAKKK